MNYEEAWKELKDEIQKAKEVNSRGIAMKNDIINYDYLAEEMYEGILKEMNKLEEKYDDRYICIKDYCLSSQLLFKKDDKYEVVDQDEYYIYVESDIKDYHGEKEWSSFTYEEFGEYFEEQKK